jgi:hypothetical protein
MRFLFAAVLLSLMGCAGTTKKPPAFVYRDQRSVTTQPAPMSKPADLVVRVESFQAQPTDSIPTSVPPGAKLVSSAEALASYGTQFYCTVGLPEHRVELGGLARAPEGNQKVQLHLGFADNRAGSYRGFNGTWLVSPGETRVVLGCSDGSITAVTLEPVAR